MAEVEASSNALAANVAAIGSKTIRGDKKSKTLTTVPPNKTVALNGANQVPIAVRVR